MIRLYCIREENGRPVGAKLMKRTYANSWKALCEQTRIVDSGKWTRVVQIRADVPLHVQAVHWASSLVSVNSRYVLEPGAFVDYVRGPNWNDPNVGYAYYEGLVKSIGTELWHEFSSYRGCTTGEAKRRFRLLMEEIGMLKEDGK